MNERKHGTEKVVAELVRIPRAHGIAPATRLFGGAGFVWKLQLKRQPQEWGRWGWLPAGREEVMRLTDLCSHA